MSSPAHTLLEAEDLEEATKFARGLNVRRDALANRVCGGLLLCLPDWLERPVAAAAPDLWSVVSSVALRRGADSFPRSTIDDWWAECDERFEAKRATLAEDLYRHGTYTFAYVFEPGSVEVSALELLELMRRVPQHTGWSTWLVADGALAPRPAAGSIECWLAEQGDGFVDPSHADFWRASPTGALYLRRGYEEDSELEPGRSFSASLPIWRVGEALLHARDLGELLDLRGHARVRFRARWTGLRGRTLSRWPGGPELDLEPAQGQNDESCSSALLELNDLRAELVSVVDELTRALFEGFGFYRPSNEAIAHHLDRLEHRR